MAESPKAEYAAGGPFRIRVGESLNALAVLFGDVPWLTCWLKFSVAPRTGSGAWLNGCVFYVPRNGIHVPVSMGWIVEPAEPSSVIVGIEHPRMSEVWVRAHAPAPRDFEMTVAVLVGAGA